jgi:Lactate dehydrogenase and related dehydrogenases
MKKNISYIILAISLLGNTFMLIYNKMQKNHLKQANEKYDKFKKYYQLLNCWIAHDNNGDSIENYFINNGYKSIAIYGSGEIGTRLYEKLRNIGIKVCYFIDEKASDISFENNNIQVYPMEEVITLEKVDVVIITPVHQYEKISKKLLLLKESIITVSIEEIFM